MFGEFSIRDPMGPRPRPVAAIVRGDWTAEGVRLEGRTLLTAIILKQDKGIQAVYLGAWGPKSVENLKTVLTDRNAPAVEIAFAPHFAGGDRYGNARSLVQALVNAGKPVRLAIQLGFQDAGTATPGSTLYRQIQGRAQELNRFLVGTVTTGRVQTRIIDLANARIAVSPSLEDGFTSLNQFNAAAQAVADGLDRAVLDRITFRWINVRSNSADNYDDGSATGVTVNRDGRTTRPLEHEYHGEIGRAGRYGVFSNDGGFVRSNGDMDGNRRADEAERASTNPDPRRNPSYLTLDQFLTGIRDQRGAVPQKVLLWRPAYNLHKRNFGQSGDPFDVVSYDKNAPRTDADAARPTFGPLEQKVLRRFLGME